MEIKIVKVPEGIEPQDIREAWIGITLPVKETSHQCRYGIDENVLTVGEEVLVYKISYEEALEALKEYNIDAFQYWNQNWEKFYHPEGFVFYEDYCQKLSA